MTYSDEARERVKAFLVERGVPLELVSAEWYIEPGVPGRSGSTLRFGLFVHLTDDEYRHLMTGE